MCRRLAFGLALLAAAVLPAAAAGATRSFTGVVEVRHADDPRGIEAAERVVLRTADGVLRLDDRRLRRFAGRRVKVLAERDGRRLEVERAVAAEGDPPYPGDGSDATWPTHPPPETGPRRVAVLLASTAEEVPLRWAKEPVEEMVFGPASSVAAHVADQSRGRATIEGDVLGWYTVDVAAGACPDYLYPAMEAAREAGVDFTGYNYVQVWFPRHDCGFNGMAFIGGPDSYINGRPPDFRLPAHELGHNLGLHHAGARVCQEAGVSTTTTGDCHYQDYGDPFDVMGHAGRALFNGFHRARLGWIRPEEIITTRAEGVYALWSINGGGTGSRLLWVPRDVPDEYSALLGQRYIAVEWRGARPPFDGFAPGDPIASGITLRLTLGMNWSWPPQLLDVTPGSAGGYGDAVLRVGESIDDPPSGMRFTLESLEHGIARVRLAYPPTAPGDVRAELVGDDGAAVAWSGASDTEGLAGYELERDGVVVARTNDLAATDAGLPRGQTVTYRVIAIDTDGNRTGSEAVTVATPPLPPPEPEPPAPPPPPEPVVDRTKPQLRLFPAVGPRGRRVPRSRRVVVLAADDRPGVTIVATLDRRRLRAASARRLVVRLPRRVLRGRHTLVVEALDAAGNRRAIRLRIVRGRLLRAARATAPAAAR